MKKLLFISCLLAVVAILACKQGNKNKIATSFGNFTEDSVQKLAHAFFQPLPAVADNQQNAVTAEKVQLGKLLYYDTRLSAKGNKSCNSCHDLQSFGVDNMRTSVGDNGKKGNRNSPTVFNAALHNMQFWDGRAKDVEEQAGMPILNSIEMGIPHKGMLVQRLGKIERYRELFDNAFPGEKAPLNYTNLEKAIAAFERTLLTPSRFDNYMQGDASALTQEEKAGLVTFIKSGCTNCHNGVGIGGAQMQRFGLVTDYRTLTGSSVNDAGRIAVTHSISDKDVFKVPGLRNIIGTYPYFHDGSIVQLDSAVKIMAKVQLNKELKKDEVNSIMAFLSSLTGDIKPSAKNIPPELVKN
jgi:cytochrome c peroxidase